MSKLQLVALASALALSAGCAVQAEPTDLPDEAAEGADEVKGAPVLEWSTSGGFVRFNAKLSVWATGAIEVSEHYFDGKTLKYADKISKKQVDALLGSIPSGFASLPSHVYRPGFIADMPSITVSAHDHTVTWVGMKGTPVASTSFQNFSSKLSGVFSDSTEKELVLFQREGGFAGLKYAKLSVKNGGAAHLTLGGVTTQKDGFVDVATMIDLHKKIARKNASGFIWYQYPSTLPGHHVPDGISTTITWDGPDGKKSVSSATGVTEPPTYRAVGDALSAIVTMIQKQ